MTDSVELSKRIQRARAAIARFAPVVDAGLSNEWSDAVSNEPGWATWHELTAKAADETRRMAKDDIARLLEGVSSLLDLFDEEPMGATYYPFKAAELIELHCRMVTGDLSDDAPVSLGEWIRRFANHVDWQLGKSGVDAGGPQYFSSEEADLKLQQERLTGADDAELREVMTASKNAGTLYVEALAAALA